MTTENTLVPASQLAELRALSARTLPHTARVYAPTESREPGGVTRTEYTTEVASLPCRLHAIRASERVQADQPADVREWDLILDVLPATPIARTHRIVIEGETAGEAWAVAVRPVTLPQEQAFRVATRFRVTDLDVPSLDDPWWIELPGLVELRAP